MSITILHISDLQFGARHIFGGNGLTPADQAYDTLVTRLGDDLDELRADGDGLAPDLLVVTGDLAETGRRGEFDQVLACLVGLSERLGLPRDRVAVVPGNHDVNRARCEGYFKTCEGDDEDPVAPYWPKWQPFEKMFNTFYDGVGGVTFAVGQPWSLFVMDALKVVVAGLNSTMAESHREEDHYGLVGEHQARWFADKLAAYEQGGWLRIGAVHHNLRRDAVLDDENLRDVDDLDRLLGHRLHLVLHGHTHTTSIEYLGMSGIPVLSTGSAAVAADVRPTEVPNQYQLLRVDADGLTRHLRMYVPGQRRWIGDTRVSRSGSTPSSRLDRQWANAAAVFPPPAREDTDRGDDEDDGAVFDSEGFAGLLAHGGRSLRDRVAVEVARERPPGEGDTFLDRVVEVAKLRHEHAEVRRIDGVGDTPTYLRLTCREEGIVTQHPVGVFEGSPAQADVDAFAGNVHSGYAPSDRTVLSDLVYGGEQVDEELRRYARGRGVRLVSFVEYQGLLDLGRYVRGQTTRLEQDALYPPPLYLAQRFRQVTPGGGDGAVEGVALGRVVDWLSADEARFVLLLGDFGRGKTFLMRELARTLPEKLPHLVPLLVELRSLEKSHGVEELVATHLLAAGEESFDARKFRYMLRSGRIVLIFDGFDELALRVTYERAADHLDTLLAAVGGQAKVVLSSRSQHFRSDRQVLTKLGERVETLAASRVAALEDFTEAQVAEFLTRLYGGDAARAQARLHLIHEIKDLLGLARNPRMLGFIANLDEQRLRAVQARTGTISSADLYEELVTTWLAGEEKRRHPRGSVRSLTAGELRKAVTALALRLWAAPDRGIGLAELTDAAGGVLATMTAKAVGMEVGEAAQQVGSGSLLVRTTEDTFTFIHQSVMEYLVAAAAAAEPAEPAGPAAETAAVAGPAAETGGETGSRQGPGESSGSGVLAARVMSALMVDFYCGAAGLPRASAWARQVLADADATQPARRNALAIALRGHDPDLPRGARLAGASLAGADLRRLDLSGADLTGADLTDARMVETDLGDAILRGARLDGGGLERARLAGADLAEASLARANLADANLTGADLTGADLTDTRMVGTNLAGATLRRARLVGAKLRNALLTGVDLADTDLTGTQVFDSDLTGATLTGSNWTRAALVTHGVLDEAYIAAPELAAAAIPGRDPATAILEPPGAANAVAFSPDGALLAHAAGNAVVISNLRTGRPVRVLTGHTGVVWSVVFSPDGTRLATGGDDGTVRLWEVATGKAAGELTGHTDAVLSVAFSPDGTRLATGGTDRTARLWEVATGKAAGKLTGHTDAVWSVAFSPDGTHLATGSHDRTVRLWEVATGKAAGKLTGHTDAVLSVAFSPDGTHLATGGTDRTVRLWEVATGRHLATLVGTRGGWWAVLLPDGSYKYGGEVAGAFWWAVKLCRFEPGELDPYLPEIRRLPADTPIPHPPATGRGDGNVAIPTSTAGQGDAELPRNTRRSFFGRSKT